MKTSSFQAPFETAGQSLLPRGFGVSYRIAGEIHRTDPPLM